MIQAPRSRWRVASDSARAVFQEFIASRLARHIAVSALLVIFSRIAGFFATTYAVRCLGPENFGISGAIYLSAVYVALLAHFGFDAVVVRQIAAQKAQAHQIAAPILSFRATVLLALSLAWGAACFIFVPAHYLWLWLLGVIFLWTQGLNFFFVFQGLEEMGWHYATIALQSGVSALLIFLFFSPGMPLGADLVVTSLASLLALLMAVGVYAHKTKQFPMGRWEMAAIMPALRESWRYWMLSVLGFTITNAQVPLLATMVTARDVGLYRSGYAIAMAVDILFSSLYSLFLPRLAIWLEQGRETFQKKLTQTVLLCLLLGGSLTLLLCFCAPLIYKALLGDAFLEGVTVFQVLMLTRCIALVAQPYSQALIAFRHDSAVFRSGLFAAALYLFLALVTVPMYGMLAMALSSLITETALLGIGLLLTRQAMRSLFEQISTQANVTSE